MSSTVVYSYLIDPLISGRRQLYESFGLKTGIFSMTAFQSILRGVRYYIITCNTESRLEFPAYGIEVVNLTHFDDIFVAEAASSTKSNASATAADRVYQPKMRVSIFVGNS